MSASYYPPEEPKSYVLPWIATVLIIAAFVAGLVVFPPSFDAPKAEAAQGVLFVGRFHPILVHTPVGALLLLILLELICFTQKGERRFGDAALLTLLVGAAGSVAAVFAGIMLSREGGYVSGNFTLHQGMGIVATAGILLALVVRLAAMGKHSAQLMTAYRAIFFLFFSIMGLGAHFGGNMSHGNKFLTEFAPPAMKSQMVTMEKWMLSFVEEKHEVKSTAVNVPPAHAATAPASTPEVAGTKPATGPDGKAPDTAPPVTKVGLGGIAPSSDKLVFQDVLLPIFEAKCNTCHNEAKAKRGLRMDTYEMAMKGGKSQEEGEGKNISPGKPDQSLSIKLVTSQVEDDDHMPPEGKEQLTKEEIALFRWWIQEGASNTLKVAGAKIPAEAQPAVDAILNAVPNPNLSIVSPQQ